MATVEETRSQAEIDADRERRQAEGLQMRAGVYYCAPCRAMSSAVNPAAKPGCRCIAAEWEKREAA